MESRINHLSLRPNDLESIGLSVSTPSRTLWSPQLARILLRFLLALLGSVVLAGPASADWTAYGERVYASSFAGFIARPDGRGGLLIGVGDIRSTTGFTGTLKFYAQHVDSSGARLVGWPLDGLPIAAPSQDAMPTDIVADEAGGAFGCWMPSSYPSGGSMTYRSSGSTRAATMLPSGRTRAWWLLPNRRTRSFPSFATTRAAAYSSRGRTCLVSERCSTSTHGTSGSSATRGPVNWRRPGRTAASH